MTIPDLESLLMSEPLFDMGESIEVHMILKEIYLSFEYVLENIEKNINVNILMILRNKKI